MNITAVGGSDRPGRQSGGGGKNGDDNGKMVVKKRIWARQNCRTHATPHINVSFWTLITQSSLEMGFGCAWWDLLSLLSLLLPLAVACISEVILKSGR